MELPVQSCLENLGISLMSEWDVLAFVFNRRTSLTSADRIASLVGYESTVVSAALERLEGERVVGRSQTLQGVSFYRILTSTDAARQGSLLQLISLSRTRAGRVLLARQLKPDSPNRGEKKLRLERKGKWLCLKTT